MANGFGGSWVPVDAPAGGAPAAPAAAAPAPAPKGGFGGKWVPVKGGAEAKPGILSRAAAALPQNPLDQSAKGEGWVPWLGERALEVGLGGVGALGGGALGALTAPVTGPVGALAGGTLGSTAGLDLANMIESYAKRKIYGEQAAAPITAGNVWDATKANLLGSAVGEGLGAVGGPLVRSMLGTQEVRDVGKLAETGAQRLATGAEEAATQKGETMAASQAKLAEKFRPQAALEARQQALGRSMEDTMAARTFAPTSTGTEGPALLARRSEFSNLLRDAQMPPTAQGGMRQILRSRDLPDEFFQQLHGMNEPTDAMRQIFSTPERAMQFAQRITTDEGRGVMRREFADAVNLGKIKPDEKGWAMMAPALKKLGFKGVLAKPEAWMKANSAIDNLPKIFEQYPGALASFNAAMKNASTKATTAESSSIVRLAMAQTEGLPVKTREAIEAAIGAAKTPEEQANAALKAFGVKVPQGQGPTLVQRAIMDFKPGEDRTTSMMKRMAVRRAIFMGGGMIAGSAGGVGGPVGIAGVGAALGLRAGLRKAWLWSIQHSPEAAEAFYRSTNNIGLPGNLETVAKHIIDASAADATAQIDMAFSGKGLGRQPVPAGEADDYWNPPLITDRTHSPGPMGKEIERQQALAIATPRTAQDPAHIDRLQDLQKDISQGKSPQLQTHLNSGRLSPEEIRKLVAKDPATLNGMFSGMDIATAMQAFSKGTPEEKQLALQPLVQKLNDEGRQMPPLQRRALMAQLSQALGQQPDQGQPDQGPQMQQEV